MREVRADTISSQTYAPGIHYVLRGTSIKGETVAKAALVGFDRSWLSRHRAIERIR